MLLERYAKSVVWFDTGCEGLSCEDPSVRSEVSASRYFSVVRPTSHDLPLSPRLRDDRQSSVIRSALYPCRYGT